jgi:beta-N-acetylhexosaminidase
VPSAFRRAIGQLLIGSFPSTTIPAELRSLAREFGLGGVILFARNIEEPGQVAELARDLQSLGGDLPLWASVDQEGGRVARLRAPFTKWPPMATLGRAGDEGLASRFAAALAAELGAVGITLDYAPVLDILTNSKNPVIGDRALAEDAESVGRLGAAIIRGLQDNGIAACGKHFPGHGDTSADSHFELPVVEHSPDRIRRVECVPFRDAIKANVAFIMTAHVLVPSFDEQKPATLSRTIVHGLLRDELGYEGVILSDDLEMRALAATNTVPDAAVEAIAAGCDGVLVCRHLVEDRVHDIDAQVQVLEALIHAVEDERIPYGRIEDALARQRRAKERFLAAPTFAAHGVTTGYAGRKGTRYRDVVGCDAHRQIAEEMARYL